MTIDPGFLSGDTLGGGLMDPQKQTSSFRWATVTSTGPLRIRLDQTPDELDATPATLVANLNVGNRVWCQIVGKRILILGVGNGGSGVHYPDLTGVMDITAAPNITLTYVEGVTVGLVTQLFIRFTYTGSTITVPTSGDIANFDVFFVDDPAWRPVVGTTFLSAHFGRLASATLYVTGELKLTAVAGSSNITSGAEWSMGATYIRTGP